MDPFSIATGALSLAGGGLKLAQILYDYVQSVQKAEKWLRPIADQVNLTAAVIKNLGQLLERSEIRKLYTSDLLKSTCDHLNGCKQAFQDLETFINSLFKLDKNGKPSLTTTAKLTLNFRLNELDLLQAHLERFKSSLDLVLAVLNIASMAKTAKSHDDIKEMKEDLKKLIRVEKAAKDREEKATEAARKSTVPLVVHPLFRKKEELSAAVLDTSKPPPPYVEDKPRTLPLPVTSLPKPAEHDASISVSSVHVPPLPVPPLPSKPPSSVVHGIPPLPSQHIPRKDIATPSLPTQLQTGADELIQHLNKCANAVSKLAAAIEMATTRWQLEGKYERQVFAPFFQGTRKAVQTLSHHELDIDFEVDDKSAASASPPKWIHVNPSLQLDRGASYQARRDDSYYEGDDALFSSPVGRSAVKHGGGYSPPIPSASATKPITQSSPPLAAEPKTYYGGFTPYATTDDKDDSPIEQPSASRCSPSYSKDSADRLMSPAPYSRSPYTPQSYARPTETQQSAGSADPSTKPSEPVLPNYNSAFGDDFDYYDDFYESQAQKTSEHISRLTDAANFSAPNDRSKTSTPDSELEMLFARNNRSSSPVTLAPAPAQMQSRPMTPSFNNDETFDLRTFGDNENNYLTYGGDAGSDALTYGRDDGNDDDDHEVDDLLRQWTTLNV